jgi:hypothetical protein
MFGVRFLHEISNMLNDKQLASLISMAAFLKFPKPNRVWYVPSVRQVHEAVSIPGALKKKVVIFSPNACSPSIFGVSFYP